VRGSTGVGPTEDQLSEVEWRKGRGVGNLERGIDLKVSGEISGELASAID
jgi:hypothetical protein